jgi:phage/plasmid-associated DNA primase
MSTNLKTFDEHKMNIAAEEAMFQAYIESFSVTGNICTHTSRDPNMKYYIEKKPDDDDDERKFYLMYQNLIRNGSSLNLMEKPQAYGPLRLDFDFKVHVDDDNIDRRYTPEMVFAIVSKIQNIIVGCVPSEDFEEKMATCLLLEKSKPRTDDGYVRDGFHLHFPHFVCEAWFYDEIVRPQVMEFITLNKLLDKCAYVNTIDKIVDDKIMTKTWTMYGSTAKPRTKSRDLREPYMITNVYTLAKDDNALDKWDCETSATSEDPDVRFRELEKALNITFDEEMVSKNQDVFYYLPKLLSIRGYPESTPLRKEVATRRRKPITRKKKIVDSRQSSEEIAKNLKTIVDGRLISMLSPARAEGYNEWMDVGWTLYCIGGGCDEALEMWIEFSHQGSSFQEGKCEEEWAKMEVKGKTMGSLIAMVRKDSPREFRQWKKQTIDYYLYNSLLEEYPNEYDLSEVVRHLYAERFVCANSKKDVWYEFVGHKWHLLDDALALKRLFCDDVRQLYYDLNCDISTKLQNLKDEPDRTKAELDRIKLEKQQKRCLKIASTLKTSSFHDKLMKMCKIQFHDPNFEEKLDKDNFLFGCENGVLDLKNGLFREGRPDDYISLSCKMNYNPEYTEDDEEVKTIREFFRRIFPDQTLRDYMLDMSCACMIGGNTNKIFVVHTGEPDGGKSAMMDLFEKTFGEYYGTFNPEMFIKGPQASSAQARPEVTQSKGKRIMTVNEVTKDQDFNPMPLKLYTGNDSNYARSLHSNGGSFRPQFTLWLCCNEPPRIPAHDNALWTRGRYLPYESKFVKTRDLLKYPVPNSEEERFHMKRWAADPLFIEQVHEFRDALLWILFNRYQDYKLRGLKDPEKVTLATQNERYKNDVFLQFIRDRIEKVEETDIAYSSTFLKLTELAEEFQSWNKENNSYLREKWTRVQLQHEFSKRFGPTTAKGRSQGWQGYRIYLETLDDNQSNLVHEALNRGGGAPQPA